MVGGNFGLSTDRVPEVQERHSNARGRFHEWTDKDGVDTVITTGVVLAEE